MRRPIIVGNWKMNTNRAEGVALAKALVAGLSRDARAEVGVCPPAVYLMPVGEAIAGSPIGLGGQNMAAQPKGAFTGEISAAMLVDVGCRYVILGHSERRQLFGETDEAVNAKVKAALSAGLTPIVCVGEVLAERESGQTAAVTQRQCEGSLAGLSAEELVRIVLAYEPVWAIGTGRTATPEQAEEVHRDLRKLLAKRYNTAAAEQVRIQYGGSVTAANAKTLLAQPNVDGALVGGASLKAEEFLAIVAAA